MNKSSNEMCAGSACSISAVLAELTNRELADAINYIENRAHGKMTIPTSGYPLFMETTYDGSYSYGRGQIRGLLRLPLFIAERDRRSNTQHEVPK